MTTAITIFTTVKNQETGRREQQVVLPETLEHFNTDNLIVAFYITSDDKFVTVPGCEFENIQADWLKQFEVA